MNVVLIGNTDWAELALWAFFLFFIGLVIYLRREDHREGYPMEDDNGHIGHTSVFHPTNKRFILAHGMGIVYKPGITKYEPMRPQARRTSHYSGAPIEPIGNPLTAGIGAGAWCHRENVPDKMWETGEPKIVPIEYSHGFSIARKDRSPIGMPVFGCDDRMAGVCTSVWVDQTERLIRYYEVRLMGDAGQSARSVTVPAMMVQINQRRGSVRVDAIRSDQFADAPVLASDREITRLEEEKVLGYFGAGYLYAKRSRLEPYL